MENVMGPLPRLPARIRLSCGSSLQQPGSSGVSRVGRSYHPASATSLTSWV